MLTLTQTADLTKKTIAILTVVVSLTLIGFLGYKIWYGHYLSTIPPVEEKPDIRFGILPRMLFPAANVSSSNFSYSLDTTTGGLPAFEKIIKVYFLPKAFVTFLSAEKVSEFSNEFGIFNPPKILSETKYQFLQDQKTLTIELDTGNFSYTKIASQSANPNPLDQDADLITGFKNILFKLGIFREGLENGPVKLKLFKFGGEGLTEASGLDAEVAKINFWPTTIDNKPILFANFNTSLVNTTVDKSSKNLEDYLSLQFIYWPIDQTTFATYPVKSAMGAFDDLKNGKGIIILEPSSPKVSITSVYLAYYQSEIYFPYLQPIFVFEGPGFVAYVEGLKEEFLAK